MKRLLFTIITLAALEAYTQVLPSPEAASMAASADVPVELYTGVATINVPLSSIEANNGFQVPIGLSYRTSGIRVQDVAGVAGLGWQLQAGGSITRIMRDQPDEQIPFSSLVNDATVKYPDSYDTEKDLFFFSFPGGSGRFFFNSNPGAMSGNVVTTNDIITLPQSDLKITFSYYRDSDNKRSSFVITDTNGTKYHFGDNTVVVNGSTTTYPGGDYLDITKANQREVGNPYNAADEIEFISTWHLKKIEYQSGYHDVDFEYTNATITDIQTTEERRLNTNGSTYSFHPTKVTREFRTIIDTKYISEVSVPKGRVVFDYGSREDLTNGLALEQIRVLDHLDNQVEDIRLNHSYFNAANSFYLNGTRGSCSSPECKRLKLESIRKNGLTIRTFDYANGETTAPGGYDPYELPPRDSYYYDHYGFFNGPGNGMNYVRHTKNASPYLNGMEREPTSSTIANMLTKVIFPTGGSTELTYGYNQNNGGARIARVVGKDETGTIISDTEYNYDPLDETVGTKPQYILNRATDNNDAEYSDFTFSLSLSNVFNLNGPEGGYTEVEVKNARTNARQVHFFWSENDYSLSPARKYRVYSTEALLGDEGPTYDNTYPEREDHIYPYSSHTLDEFRRGLTKKIVSYDEANKKVSEVENFYIHNGSGTTKNNVITFEAEDVDPGIRVERWYVVSEYFIHHKYLQMNYSITRSFDNDGVMVSQNRTDYTYHSVYKTLPKVVETTRLDAGESFNSTVTTHYPMDHAAVTIVHNPTIINNMITNGLIGVPLQTISRREFPKSGGGTEYRIVGSSITTFNAINNYIHPFETYVTQLSAPTTSTLTPGNFRKTSTQTYTSAGLPYERTGSDDSFQRFAYDSRGYISYVDAGTVGSPLRRTSYTYKNLVGVETITDPNGRTVTYEYDGQNRLLLTRDQDNNIVERQRYSAINDDDQTGVITISGANKTGVTQTVSASIPTVYGGADLTEFRWKVNGSDQTSTNASFGRTFSAGLQSVDVTLINPDYDEPIVLPTAQKMFYSSYWSTGPIEVFPSGSICTDTGSGPSQLVALTVSPVHGASSCGSDSQTRTYEWYWRSGSGPWQSFGPNGPGADFPLSALASAGSVDLKVDITDICGTMKTTPISSVTVTDCGSDGGGGDDPGDDDSGGGGPGDGGSGSTPLIVDTGTINGDSCPTTTIYLFASVNGASGTCDDLINYTWEVRLKGSTTWRLLGTSTVNEFTTTGSAFVNGSSYGIHEVRVRITDNCGRSATDDTPIEIAVNASCPPDGF